MTVGTWVLVAVLGGTGAVARFVIDGIVGERANSAFPWGTLTVNLTGSALLGFLAGAALRGNALVLTGTATLGSYTTLSTWLFETHRLGQDDQLLGAALNLLGPLVAGFGALALGHAVGAAL
jgi:CrcB protein